jgi:hypothetical protein
MNIRGFGKICNLNKIDVLITDNGIDNETKAETRRIRDCYYRWKRIELHSYRYKNIFGCILS